MKKNTWLKMLIAAAVVGGLIWFNHHYLNIKPQTIREWILSFGAFAPFIFIGLYTVRPLILFPASILSLSAGLAFGALWGTIYTVIGATAGAALSYYVARKLGHRVVNQKWKRKGEILQTQLEKNGFFYVFLLRLIPLFHFDMISYLAGLANVKFMHFLLATLLGIIPGTFAYNFLGSSLVAQNTATIVVAMIVFLVILLVPIMTSAKVREKLGLQRKGE
jgi:uncharacterized membrane protein YdjX (TVP38/TMEM64 family)